MVRAAPVAPVTAEHMPHLVLRPNSAQLEVQEVQGLLAAQLAARSATLVTAATAVSVAKAEPGAMLMTLMISPAEPPEVMPDQVAQVAPEGPSRH